MCEPSVTSGRFQTGLYFVFLQFYVLVFSSTNLEPGNSSDESLLATGWGIRRMDYKIPYYL